MKTLICLLGIGLIVCQSAFSKKISEKDLPAAVRDSFVYTYPMHDNSLGKVNWFTYNNMQYYAKFRINGQFATAMFSEDGRCIETSIQVNAKQIPSNILETLRTLYPGYDIFRAEDVISYSTRYYRLNLSNGKKEVMIVMDYTCGILAEKDVVPEP
jgi:hypothetical protein